MNKDKLIKGLKWVFNSFIWLAVILFVLDIVSKHLVFNHFADGNWANINTNFVSSKPDIQIIPGLLSISYTYNPGMAFGMLREGGIERRIILIGISLIMSAAFIVYYSLKFKKLNRFYKAILMCLAAGAIGNLIDRAFYPDGLVIDFIKFDFMNFPLFNIADATLVCSIFAMLVYMIVEEVIKYVNKKKLEKASANNALVEEENNAENAEEKNEGSAEILEKNAGTAEILNEEEKDKKDE